MRIAILLVGTLFLARAVGRLRTLVQSLLARRPDVCCYCSYPVVVGCDCCPECGRSPRLPPLPVRQWMEVGRIIAGCAVGICLVGQVLVTTSMLARLAPDRAIFYLFRSGQFYEPFRVEAIRRTTIQRGSCSSSAMAQLSRSAWLLLINGEELEQQEAVRLLCLIASNSFDDLDLVAQALESQSQRASRVAMLVVGSGAFDQNNLSLIDGVDRLRPALERIACSDNVENARVAKEVLEVLEYQRLRIHPLGDRGPRGSNMLLESSSARNSAGTRNQR